MALSPKQERFVAEYPKDCNATAAARRAGYSTATCHVQGPRLLANVRIQQALSAKQSRIANRLEISADNILREMARIAFSDLRRVTSFGPDGVVLKDGDSLDSDDAACIKSVSQTTSVGGGSIKIELHNKVDALTKLANHLGLFKERTPLEAMLAAIPEPHRSDLIAALASDVRTAGDSRTLPATSQANAASPVGT